MKYEDYNGSGEGPAKLPKGCERETADGKWIQEDVIPVLWGGIRRRWPIKAKPIAKKKAGGTVTLNADTCVTCTGSGVRRYLSGGRGTCRDCGGTGKNLRSKAKPGPAKPVAKKKAKGPAKPKAQGAKGLEVVTDGEVRIGDVITSVGNTWEVKAGSPEIGYGVDCYTSVLRKPTAAKKKAKAKVEAKPGPFEDPAYQYWFPGDAFPAKFPAYCEWYEKHQKKWREETMPPADYTWFLITRRWPKTTPESKLPAHEVLAGIKELLKRLG
jgi:hypothetical protein